MIGVTVTYVNRFSDVFARITRSSNNAVDRTCAEIEDVARSLVRIKSGDTYRSIHSEVVSEGMFGTYSKQVMATTPQATYLEYGTVHQPAYPFMTPAAEQVTPRVNGIVSEAFSW